MSTEFTNLNDDMVKLVAYAIISVRRGHERILDGGEGTLLVIGKMTVDSFTSFIIGRYLQQEVSKDDKDEANETKPKQLRRIPEEDRRFLRVHFVVSNRWPREPEKFEEEQIAVLEEIRQAIP